MTWNLYLAQLADYFSVIVASPDVVSSDVDYVCMLVEELQEFRSILDNFAAIID
jgi:hypothetical protein